jgi:DNA-directed RNA polymerase subunit RPC12/RpoP
MRRQTWKVFCADCGAGWEHSGKAGEACPRCGCRRGFCLVRGRKVPVGIPLTAEQAAKEADRK